MPCESPRQNEDILYHLTDFREVNALRTNAASMRIAKCNFASDDNPMFYQVFLISVSKANPPLGSRVALTATRGET